LYVSLTECTRGGGRFSFTGGGVKMGGEAGWSWLGGGGLVCRAGSAEGCIKKKLKPRSYERELDKKFYFDY
jgi:hypothetical protein